MKHLAVLALLVAAPALAAPSDPTRYAACIELAGKDPAGAMQMAYAWRIEGGGVAPRHCLAVAQMHARHHEAALKSYEAAGEASEAARDGQAIALWRQAADAAMIAEQPADAARFLGRALARPGGAELSPRAEAALLKAAALAPDSADVELEAGNIAAAKGDLALARQAWEAAAADAPDTPAGRAAAAALGRMNAKLPEKPLTDGALPATPR